MMTQHPTSPHSVPLIAVAFRTPTHDAQPLVKLLPEPLVLAETAALQTIGLTPVTHTPVGHTHNRALGFPTHPILTHPDNAHHALNLVKDLQWARRQAKTHPEEVEEFTDNLITQLSTTTPQLLPTFLEEIARIYVATHELSLAEKYFDQAREIERTYALPIDCKRHTHAFREFARHGVISASTFSHEACDITTRLSPEEAYKHFFNLLITQARVRETLYEDALIDLEKLGAHCGHSTAYVHTHFAAAFIPTKSYQHSSEKLLNTLTEVVAEAADINPEIRDHIIRVIPENCTAKPYFSYLKQSGAWELLIADHTRLRQWLITTIEYATNRHFFTVTDENSIDMLLEQKEALQGINVNIEPVRCYFLNFHLDFLDVFLEIGIILHYSLDDEWIMLPHWVSNHHRDLKFLLKEPYFLPYLFRSFTSNFDDTLVECFLETDLTKEFLFSWLEHLRQQYRSACGSQEQLKEFQRKLPDLNDPRLKQINAEAIAEIYHIDAATELKERIRRGTKVEYTWPEFEKLTESLDLNERVSTNACFPYVAVAQKTTLHLLDGTSHRVVDIPPTVDIEYITVTDDDIFLVYVAASNGEYHTWWHSENISRLVETDDHIFGNDQYVQPIGGIPYIGTTPVLKGEPLTELLEGANIGIQPCYGTSWYDYDDLITPLPDGEPITEDDFQKQLRAGTLAGFEIPHPFMKSLPAHAELGLVDSFVVEATHNTRLSPLGVDSGRHYSYVFWEKKPAATCHFVTPLGSTALKHRYYRCSGFLPNLIKKPGSQSDTFENMVWLVKGTLLHDLASKTPISPSLTGTGEQHFLERLPYAGFHYLTVRNETVSRKMRQCTVGQAAAMISNPLEILDFTDGDETLAAAIAGMIVEINEINGVDIQLAPLKGVPAPLEYLYETLAFSENDSLIARELASIPNPPDFDRDIFDYFHIVAGFYGKYSPDSLKLLALPARQPRATWEINPDRENIKFIVNAIGREKLLLSWLALPHVPLAVVREYHPFFQWCAQVGVLGMWHRITVSAEEHLVGHYISWDNGVFAARTYQGDTQFWNPQSQPRPAVSSIELFDEDYFLPKEKFLAALDDILYSLESQHEQNTNKEFGWIEKTVDEAAEDAAQVSTIPPYLWRFLFAGDPIYAFRSEEKEIWEKYHYDPQQTLGITYEETLSLRKIITASLNSHARALVALSWHEDFPRTGPNIDAIRSTWQTLWGTPWIHLTDTMFTHLRPTLEKLPHNLWHHFHQTHPNPTAVGEENSHLLFNLYTHLAHLVTPNSPTALTLAKRLELFTTYNINQPHPLGGDYPTSESDPDLADKHSPLLVKEGILDSLIHYLKTGTPFSGAPQDPLVSAPHTVNHAAQTLGLTNDGARYFLQLLALANPTDINIQKWNSWSTHQLDQARNELLAKNLVITAERDHTGRSIFLPGGWLPHSDTGPGIETWKTPHYPLWKAPVSRPLIPSCPPLLPYPQLFTEVWQRYTTGDTPTYER